MRKIIFAVSLLASVSSFGGQLVTMSPGQVIPGQDGNYYQCGAPQPSLKSHHCNCYNSDGILAGSTNFDLSSDATDAQIANTATFNCQQQGWASGSFCDQ